MDALTALRTTADDPDRPYYSGSQAAARLRLSRVTIWRWLRAGGRYVCLNAAEALMQIMRAQVPDRARFMDVVGELIEEHVAAGRRVLVFGEMVALLAAQGNHAAVIELEALWNELRREHSFS